MILEYSVNEAQVQPAWLKTLYDLVEELLNNLKEREQSKCTVPTQCFRG